MIKIIETNISKDFKDNNSFQSRVIEVESWDYIIKLLKKGDGEIKCPDIFTDIFNNCYRGVIRPRFSRIKDLHYDEDRLTCTIIDSINRETKKLIQVIS